MRILLARSYPPARIAYAGLCSANISANKLAGYHCLRPILTGERARIPVRVQAVQYDRRMGKRVFSRQSPAPSVQPLSYSPFL